MHFYWYMLAIMFYNYLCNIDDYLKALMKLRDAELTSNFESEMEAPGERPERKKRYVPLNVLYCLITIDASVSLHNSCIDNRII